MIPVTSQESKSIVRLTDQPATPAPNEKDLVSKIRHAVINLAERIGFGSSGMNEASNSPVLYDAFVEGEIELHSQDPSYSELCHIAEDPSITEAVQMKLLTINSLSESKNFGIAFRLAGNRYITKAVQMELAQKNLGINDESKKRSIIYRLAANRSITEDVREILRKINVPCVTKILAENSPEMPAPARPTPARPAPVNGLPDEVRNAYSTLGIDPLKSVAETKTLLRKILLDSHPDKKRGNGNPNEINARFSKIFEAYKLVQSYLDNTHS